MDTTARARGGEPVRPPAGKPAGLFNFKNVTVLSSIGFFGVGVGTIGLAYYYSTLREDMLRRDAPIYQLFKTLQREFGYGTFPLLTSAILCGASTMDVPEAQSYTSRAIVGASIAGAAIYALRSLASYGGRDDLGRTSSSGLAGIMLAFLGFGGCFAYLELKRIM
ncbi:hypothetical protein QOT17_007260 [Balamuthia mandrillaris]